MFDLTKLLYISLLFTTQCLCKDIEPEEYLVRYGYLDTMSRSNSNKFKKALQLFQWATGLPITAIFDNKTQELMSKIRCGNGDPIDQIESRFIWGKKDKNPNAGYILQGSKWTNNMLTYRIKEPDSAADSYWSTKISKEWTKQLMKWSFDMWSSVTPLQFEYVDRPQQKVHISLQFSKGIHCCDSVPPLRAKFDGKKGEMAHTKYPQYGGDIHIDDDEDWRVPNDNLPGIQFAPALIHEIGHALGLEHVWQMDSVMYPWYRFDIGNGSLSEGDIEGIRVLYGNQSISLKGKAKLVIV